MSDEFDWIPVTSMDDVRPGDAVRYDNKHPYTVDARRGSEWSLRLLGLDGKEDIGAARMSIDDDGIATRLWSVRRAKAKPAVVVPWHVGQVRRGVIVGAETVLGREPREFTVREKLTGWEPLNRWEIDVKGDGTLGWSFEESWPNDLIRDVEPATSDPLVKGLYACTCGRVDIPKDRARCYRCDEEAARKCAPGCNPGAPCMGAVCPGHKEGELLFNGALQPFVCAAEKTAPLLGNDPGRWTDDDHWRAKQARLEEDRTRGPVVATWGRAVIK